MATITILTGGPVHAEVPGGDGARATAGEVSVKDDKGDVAPNRPEYEVSDAQLRASDIRRGVATADYEQDTVTLRIVLAKGTDLAKTPGRYRHQILISDHKNLIGSAEWNPVSGKVLQCAGEQNDDCEALAVVQHGALTVPISAISENDSELRFFFFTVLRDSGKDVVNDGSRNTPFLDITGLEG